MKQNNDLTLHIADAADLVHRAYFGQCLSLAALASPTAIRPPEDLLFLSQEWLRKTQLPPCRERLLMTFLEIDLRHYFAREISEKAYALLREKRWKKGVSPLAVFSTQLACKTRDELCDVLNTRGIHNALIETIQEWRQWDGAEIGGWLFENIQQTIQEVDTLWSKVQLVALRLKNNGQLPASTMRELCADILGAGLKGDREMEIISRFHYDHEYHGLKFTTSINDGIPFVKFVDVAQPMNSGRSQDPEEIGNQLLKRLPLLTDGSDSTASAGRLLMLLHTGNYIAVGDRLCRVSLPIEPTRGVIATISQPENVHPMMADYSQSARVALRFSLAGFLWPTMEACGHDMKLVEAVIEGIWIPKIFKTFFVIAGDKTMIPGCALAFSTSIYARLVAIEGLFNPLIMRRKLKELLLETASILGQYKETASDLEQAIQCGLFRGPDDILALAGNVVDAGLPEDPRFATLILYQRVSSLLAVRAQPPVHS